MSIQDEIVAYNRLKMSFKLCLGSFLHPHNPEKFVHHYKTRVNFSFLEEATLLSLKSRFVVIEVISLCRKQTTGHGGPTEPDVKQKTMKTRTVRFRGKRTYNGDWVYGDLCEYREDLYIKEDPDCWDIQLCDEVDPDTVGQFTGIQLKDINNNEIIDLYEGDVITAGGMKYEMVYSTKELGFVAQNDDGEYICGLNIMSKPHHWCIVGNIHDNPELIKK